MISFRKALQDKEILIFDGAMGTLLQAKGMPAGQSPEEFGLTSPGILREAHEAYRQAGARVLTTNTFGGTRFKLGPEVNVRALARIVGWPFKWLRSLVGFVIGWADGMGLLGIARYRPHPFLA